MRLAVSSHPLSLIPVSMVWLYQSTRTELSVWMQRNWGSELLRVKSPRDSENSDTREWQSDRRAMFCPSRGADFPYSPDSLCICEMGWPNPTQSQGVRPRPAHVNMHTCSQTHLMSLSSSLRVILGLTHWVISLFSYLWSLESDLSWWNTCRSLRNCPSPREEKVSKKWCCTL